MGLAVSEDRVEQAATRIGCGVLKAPFAYLGSIVGGSMSRIKSWEDIVGKMVPMKVLHRMESIRCHFFNGIELNSKKSIWVKWSNVLSSKEKGGIGVSSLYALNRALMFKWVWRFTTQKDSLWASVIKAIHGVDGKIGSGSKNGHNCMQKKLGNGADTSFWDDMWRGDTTLKQRFHRSGVEQSQMMDLMAYIEGVVLGVASDRWYWSLDGSGEFTVASVKKVIDDIRLPVVATQTRRIKAVPIKVNVNAWMPSKHK
ncbi:hypothetical protein Tco_1027521, partial [Tanacetum coccineum]